jgi:hypothetical protein
MIFPNITTTSFTYPGWDMYCYSRQLALAATDMTLRNMKSQGLHVRAQTHLTVPGSHVAKSAHANFLPA